MAIVNIAPSNRRWFVGSFGNLSISPTLTFDLKNVAANDVVVSGDVIPGNLKIIGMSVHTKWTANTRVYIKIANAQIATDAVLSIEDGATAQNKYLAIDDLITTGEQRLTVTGTAVTTGVVKVKLHYEVIGNL